MSRKLTQEEVSDHVFEIHGDIYDMSHFRYINSKTPSTVVCRVHGGFETTFDCLRSGRGCKRCGYENNGKLKKGRRSITEKTTNSKRCSKCKEVKNISEFSPAKGQTHGVSCTCKKCECARTRAKNSRSLYKLMYKTHKRCVTCKSCLPINEYITSKGESKFCIKCRVERTKYFKSEEYIAALVERKRINYAKNRNKIIADNKKKRRSPARYELLHGKLLPEDKPEDRGGLLFVACKKCGRMFNPSNSTCYSRIKTIKCEPGRESNFYCSNKCKESCDIYSARTRRKSQRKEPEKLRNCMGTNRKNLTALNCETYGSVTCERCGDIVNLELHHTETVKDRSNNTMSPAGMMLLCFNCHLEVHRECK